MMIECCGTCCHGDGTATIYCELRGMMFPFYICPLYAAPERCEWDE